MQYSIESIRDGIAALAGDDGSLLHLDARALPAGAQTGDILLRQADGSFLPQPRLTGLRQARARALFRKFKRKNPL